MSAKIYNIVLLIIISVFLMLIALPIVIIDPYFHYHKPLADFAYILEDERHQNNGIVRHFEYNAIITGTSMTQNFKTSMFDEYFGTHSVKVTYAGAHFKEVNDNILVALEENPDIVCVFRGLDTGEIVKEEDLEFDGISTQGYVYPYYLLDSNPFNDVSYFFNKDIFYLMCRDIVNTRAGNTTTSFDEYQSFRESSQTGKEVVLSTYVRPEYSDYIITLQEEERKIVIENIRQNVTSVAEAYPDVTFYYFFTPYSICSWDMLHQRGTVDYTIETQRVVIEEILKYPNIRLFSFDNDFDLICNLDNYIDAYHYSGNVNDKILYYINNGEYEITRDNYQEYLLELHGFYNNYDYESIYD